MARNVIRRELAVTDQAATSSAIERLAQAERMLADIATTTDAANLADYAAAAADYARRAKLGNSAVNHATTIRALAEMKLASLVEEGQQAGAIAPAHRTVRAAGTSTLPELGVDRRRLAEARKIRDTYSEDQVRALADEATASGEEFTRASLLKGGPHVSHNSGDNEWYSPPDLVAAARAAMGDIDLDPASSPEANEVVKAAEYYTAEDDGLAQPLYGRVWMNPPYARGLVGKFCAKLAEEYGAGRVTEAVILVNNSTDSEWFQELVATASGVCLVRGRIRYWQPGRESASPLQGQVILYLGSDSGRFAAEFSGFGAVLGQLS